MAKKTKTWAWDLEAEDWDRVTCACAVSDAGDVITHYGGDALQQISADMDREGGNWIAHAGGIYDTLLVLNVRARAFRELVLSGSAILLAKDGNLKVRDSFRWWLSSLAAVGEYVDKVRGGTGEWKKKAVDRQRIKSLSREEVIAYCLHDCRILLAGVQLAIQYLEDQGARVGWTSGACALNLLQRLEPASWAMLHRYRLDEETAAEARACVRGARVECWAQGRVDGVYVYDFKSAYPAAYKDHPLPIGARKVTPADRAVEGTIWRARWCWPWRDRLPPVLDLATGAGAGWCEAWIVPEERAELEKHVGVELVEGWAPECVAPIGQVFLRDLYKQKEAGSFFAKVFLNSLHGKFSENSLRESWTSTKPETWVGPDPVRVGDYWHAHTTAADAKGDLPRHVQPLAAATILGRTRARLYRALAAVLEAGGRIFYCDTDSVHCSLPPDRMAELGRVTGAFTIGQQIGELNPEGGPFVAYYAGPKAYAMQGADGKIKGALKGAPWKALSDGVRVVVDGLPVYAQARDDETGADFRLQLFRDVLEGGRAAVRKEGITTFSAGMGEVLRAQKKGADSPAWLFRRRALLRTIRSDNKNKRVVRDGGPWAYRQPAEVAALRASPIPAAVRAGRAVLSLMHARSLYREGCRAVEAAGGFVDERPGFFGTFDSVNEKLDRRGARRVTTPWEAWRGLYFRRVGGVDTASDCRAKAAHLADCCAVMREIPGLEAWTLADTIPALALAAQQIEAAVDAVAAAANADTSVEVAPDDGPGAVDVVVEDADLWLGDQDF